MGICISTASSEIPETEDVHEILVYSEENTVIHGAQGLGSLYSKTGSKGLNQDAAILYQGYGMEDGTFCGVFDGHGDNGHIVSKIVRNRLPSLLLSQMNALQKFSMAVYVDHLQNEKETLDGASVPNKSNHKWQEACISSAFKMMDTVVKLQKNLDSSTSGTTAVIVIRQGEDLVIANLGDSRALLGTITENGVLGGVQLTTDLNPSLPSKNFFLGIIHKEVCRKTVEANRIRKCNGRVLALKEKPHIQRVWLPHANMPGLAISRAFGDFQLKDFGITAIPDISFRRLSSNDQFLVLATDGVWNVLSNDKVASIVWASNSEEEAAQAVVDAATTSWQQTFPSSKVDDCTVVCLFFQKRQNNPSCIGLSSDP